MKKTVIVLFFILLVVIFLIFLLSKTLIKTKPDTQNLLPTPTSVDYLPKNTTDKKIEVLKNIKILPSEEEIKLQALKKILPLKSNYFEIDYSSALDIFIITKKTPEAEAKFKNWAQSRQLETIIDNFPNLFVFTDQPLTEHKKYLEEIYQETKEDTLKQSPSSKSSPSTNNINQNKGIEILSDLFNILENIANSSVASSSSALVPPTPSLTPPLISPQYSSTSLTLIELFNEIGQKVGVPPRVLEAIMRVEDGEFFTISPSLISQYATPGNIISNCGPNKCAATGPMQMTIGVDLYDSPSCSTCTYQPCYNQWAAYGKAVNTYGGYTHIPNPCNLRDNIYAAAAKLKNNSGVTGYSLDWTDDQIYTAAHYYYGIGKCDDAHHYTRYPLNGRTYCEFVVDYYHGR